MQVFEIGEHCRARVGVHLLQRRRDTYGHPVEEAAVAGIACSAHQFQSLLGQFRPTEGKRGETLTERRPGGMFRPTASVRVVRWNGEAQPMPGEVLPDVA